MMVRQGFSIRQASCQLKLNYSAAKYIIKSSQITIEKVTLPKISSFNMTSHPTTKNKVGKDLPEFTSSLLCLKQALKTLKQ